MVEFRHDRKHNNVFLMEVNGRYWGSLPLTIRAGMDFPFFEWQLAHGEKPTVPMAYRIGVTTRWLSGDIRRLQELVTQPKREELATPTPFVELLRFLRDFRPPIRPAIWSWSDPLPAVYQLRATLKQVIEDTIRSPRIKQYRALEGREMRLLVGRRLLHAIGLIKHAPPKDLSKIERILFVCHGNILRSPMAAALLIKHLANLGLDQFRIVSAGVTKDPQNQSDKRAEVAAKEFGIELKEHKPRRVTAEMVREADLIFVTDRFNEAVMLSAYPQARHKTFMLGTVNGEFSRYNEVEIWDPNLGHIADVRRCYLLLDKLTRRLAEALRSARNSESAVC